LLRAFVFYGVFVASHTSAVVHLLSLPPLCRAGFDAKKVTKKNQGKPDRSARFALPTPHITLRKKFFV
jgi:hypothetical protein